MVQVLSVLVIPLLTLFFGYVASSSIDLSVDTSEYNRPLIHFTPEKGWMNDPNGLFYDKTAKLWHLYFQYNPNATAWGQPLYWGHATSNDLVHWDEHEIAIGPEHDNEGIFSGSIVVDHNNTSGFFNSSIDPNQRIVAIYTNNIPDNQTQDIAFSLDGGYTFTKYENNPVIDVSSNQFRDPKVFWHEDSNQWIMVVSKSQEYKIQIFGSANLKNWVLNSNFSSGYYGNQYACPGLIEVPIENSDKSKWVMFLAINPGSPLGGSINQYFVGDFDGFQFVPDDSQTRFVDIGKDFYAFQTFSEVEHGVLGLAWASNWQYADQVPTNPWRSSTSLARNYTLRYVHTNAETKQLTLIQNPVLPDSINVVDKLKKKNVKLTNKKPIKTNFKGSTGLFDFNITFKVLNLNVSPGKTHFDILINSQELNSSVDSIKIGFDSSQSSFYIDRHIPNVEFPRKQFFTDKLAAYLEPLDYDQDLRVFSLYGIVDKNIIELYFNDGTVAMTNTFFMGEGKYPHDIQIVTDTEEPLFELESVIIRELNK
uniref:Fructofuranosidase n=1 Tax=Schwanniomyces occidentalis TaxID=27300 RepID=UPI00025C0719|nr:Chain A, Fructofuranosidase [Schwanniomyces occidentalis]3U75_B Chain B, Fructofuranosidase [Schwanniomyces occidentalis]3U75_C Chain C, Fructofuranosidase [Schwanniomyces occidentalis]3U75_D Chain D, Fructofuranosidase [Schwanniomyces occidentalis]